MKRFLLIGITAFAMTAGVALAQSSTTETITHGSSSLSIIQGGGIQTEQTRTDTDSNGDSQTRSRTQTTAPDGETTTTHTTTTVR